MKYKGTVSVVDPYGFNPGLYPSAPSQNPHLYPHSEHPSGTPEYPFPNTPPGSVHYPPPPGGPPHYPPPPGGPPHYPPPPGGQLFHRLLTIHTIMNLHLHSLAIGRIFHPLPIILIFHPLPMVNTILLLKQYPIFHQFK